jgi:hypothetical protein
MPSNKLIVLSKAKGIPNKRTKRLLLLVQEDGRKNPEQANDEGSEFWPAISGLRLKITDAAAVQRTSVRHEAHLPWSSSTRLSIRNPSAAAF